MEKAKSLKSELTASGIEALYLFGSFARAEAHDDSDIDFAFDVAPDVRFSLLDQAHSQLRLAEVLGRRVDLVERDALRAAIRDRIEREMIRVF